jgi:hypothetical protein
MSLTRCNAARGYEKICRQLGHYETKKDKFNFFFEIEKSCV